MKEKVVISEDLWWDVPKDFQESYDVVYDGTLAGDPARLYEAGAEARGLVVRNRTQINGELLSAFPDLQVVGRLGVGLDNIDLNACREKGVAVVAAKGCNAVSVAEYVIACLFHHARFLHVSDSDIRANRWDRLQASGFEVFGKTLGLVGVGDIGQRVATRARALGLRVIAYDPFILPTSPLVQDVGVELMGLDAVLKQAHYISIHVPLTPQTHHLMSQREFALMREDTVLVNTSRGGTIDESALFDALRDAPQRRSYLDVREKEPPGVDDKLLRLPNVISTPHVAGITRESSERVAMFVLRQVDTVLRGGEAQGRV